jgi:hypothetical protein
VDRAPHYLRVVQALALVSGFGGVAMVAGATVVDCFTWSDFTGALDGGELPEDSGSLTTPV